MLISPITLVKIVYLSGCITLCGYAAALNVGQSTAVTRPPAIDQVVKGAPFSFVYDGKPSHDLLPRWKQAHLQSRADGGKETSTTTYTDPATGLEVSREVTLFPGTDAVECILRLRNTGLADTPIIEKIMPLDLHLAQPRTARITLHYARGSLGTGEDFQAKRSGAYNQCAHHANALRAQGHRSCGRAASFLQPGVAWRGG